MTSEDVTSLENETSKTADRPSAPQHIIFASTCLGTIINHLRQYSVLHAIEDYGCLLNIGTIALYRYLSALLYLQNEVEFLLAILRCRGSRSLVGIC